MFTARLIESSESFGKFYEEISKTKPSIERIIGQGSQII